MSGFRVRIPFLAGSALAGLVVLMVAPVRAQQPETITENDVIAGTMEIEFKTRTSRDTSGELVEGSPPLGVQDVYTLNLTVAKSTEFSGRIVRQPNLYTRTLR
jgi:hypothetical protein